MKILIDANKLDKKTFTQDIQSSGANVLTKNNRGKAYTYDIELGTSMQDFLKKFSKTGTFHYTTFKELYMFLEDVNSNIVSWDQDSTCKVFGFMPYQVFDSVYLEKQIAKYLFYLDEGYLGISAFPIENIMVEDADLDPILNFAIDWYSNLGDEMPSEGLKMISSHKLKSAFVIESDLKLLESLLEDDTIHSMYTLDRISKPFSIVYEIKKTELFSGYLSEKRAEVETYKKEILGSPDSLLLRESDWKLNRERAFAVYNEGKNNISPSSIVQWQFGEQVYKGMFMSYVNADPEMIVDKMKSTYNDDGAGRRVSSRWMGSSTEERPLALVYQTKVTSESVVYEIYGVPIDGVVLLYEHNENQIVKYIGDFHRRNSLSKLNVSLNEHAACDTANATFNPETSTITYNLEMLWQTIARNLVEDDLRWDETIQLIAAHEYGHATSHLFPYYEIISRAVDSSQGLISKLPFMFGRFFGQLGSVEHIDVVNKLNDIFATYHDSVIHSEFNAWKEGRQYIPEYLLYAFDRDNWDVLRGYLNERDNQMYMLHMWKKELLNQLGLLKKDQAKYKTR